MRARATAPPRPLTPCNHRASAPRKRCFETCVAPCSRTWQAACRHIRFARLARPGSAPPCPRRRVRRSPGSTGKPAAPGGTNGRAVGDQWYTAIAQLTSRLTHPHGETWSLLYTVLVRVVRAHPFQAIWHMLPHLSLARFGPNEAVPLDSSGIRRRERCTAILDTAVVWGAHASWAGHPARRLTCCKAAARSQPPDVWWRVGGGGAGGLCSGPVTMWSAACCPTTNCNH